MKLLFVVHQFLPEFSAGTEVLCLTTARALRDAGHEVVLVTALTHEDAVAADRRFDEYEFDGFRIHRYNRQRKAPIGDLCLLEADFRNPIAADWFDALLDREKPDLVHVFHLMRHSALLVDVCRRRGVPTVLTVTDLWFLCPLGQMRLEDDSPCPGPGPGAVRCVRHFAELSQAPRVRRTVRRMPDLLLRAAGWLASRLLARRFAAAASVRALQRRPAFLRKRLNRIDRVIVPTNLTRDAMAGFGLEADRTRLCHYGLAWTPPDAPPRTFDRRPLTVGFIGSFIPTKGAHVLIEAMRRLEGRDIRAVLYGHVDPNSPYATALPGSAGANVTFAGTFPNERIGEVLREMDVLAIPSLWKENTPLVLLSAMADRCPVLGADQPGITEIARDGINARIVPPGDANALADAIVALDDDRDELARLSAGCTPPKDVAQYTQETLAIYRELPD